MVRIVRFLSGICCFDFFSTSMHTNSNGIHTRFPSPSLFSLHGLRAFQVNAEQQGQQEAVRLLEHLHDYGCFPKDPKQDFEDFPRQISPCVLICHLRPNMAHVGTWNAFLEPNFPPFPRQPTCVTYGLTWHMSEHGTLIRALNFLSKATKFGLSPPSLIFTTALFRPPLFLVQGFMK